jgi:hypothetical protein
VIVDLGDSASLSSTKDLEEKNTFYNKIRNKTLKQP